MSAREEWAALAEAGLSAAEAARARGVTRGAACRAAKVYGLRFRDGWREMTDYERTAWSARVRQGLLRRYSENPGFLAAQRERLRAVSPALPPRARLAAARRAALSDAERADYEFLRGRRYTVAEALRAVGRADLAELRP